MGNLSTPDSVQKLQTALHAKAKAEPGYRFYVLYDKISRDDILAHAYAQCRSNKGAPGVDRQDFEAVETYGVGDGLANWRLRSGKRLTDRTLSTRLHTEGRKSQAAGHLNLAGSGLHDSSDAGAGADLQADLPSKVYAYRPGRNAQQAWCGGELLFAAIRKWWTPTSRTTSGAFPMPSF